MNIEVDAGAKAFAKAEVRIDATPEIVYDILSHIRKWPSWQEDVSRTKINNVQPEAGTEFSWKVNGMTIKSRLHTANYPAALGWTGEVWWYKAIHNWHMVPDGDGGTYLTVVESMSGFGASLMQGMLRKSVRKNAKELKRAAEHK
ncbi:SRPBCC family protein [Roseivirga sp. BDSF3-8]|uniref:SRPBCC family protein n=1 Tax=Roseivirga sp. BDSF3-8 TaxID=3241598 RepID=UPI003531F655